MRKTLEGLLKYVSLDKRELEVAKFIFAFFHNPKRQKGAYTITEITDAIRKTVELEREEVEDIINYLKVYGVFHQKGENKYKLNKEYR